MYFWIAQRGEGGGEKGALNSRKRRRATSAVRDLDEDGDISQKKKRI